MYTETAMDTLLSGRNMKRFIAVILSLTLTLFLLGCGATYYRVTTKTGEVYTVRGAPKYDMSQKTYTFHSEEGEQVILNKEEIEDIVETK